MRTSLAAIISGLAALAASVPQGDPSAVFYAELFSTVADCSATSGVHAFLYSRGECQNTAIPGTGSARVRYNDQPDALSLTGWTGADCTGDSVPIGTTIGLCVALNGTSVASWSY
ncbi:hypothetical protein F4821DRAFT_9447 [Hypoxylon rubiginosum]|uniref:Uncharacterized protein n=1 Tax=Hypoxylon rubiginosum TaxID=110542 RepID=A0ACC0DDT8_9PEZI|nr:hypothetical protein F4821DRAFT_9447 [Hypoxylon rubiginosum]